MTTTTTTPPIYGPSHRCAECLLIVPSTGTRVLPARQRFDCPVCLEYPPAGGCSAACRLTHACSEQHLAEHVYTDARHDPAHQAYLRAHYPYARCCWCEEPIVTPNPTTGSSYVCRRNGGHPHAFRSTVTRWAASGMTEYAVLERAYQAALDRSGLPHRSPSHRIVEQAVAAGEALAYATALHAITGDDHWKGAAARIADYVRGRLQIAQSDIDAGDRAESKLRRYGGHLLP